MKQIRATVRESGLVDLSRINDLELLSSFDDDLMRLHKKSPTRNLTSVQLLQVSIYQDLVL
jgi:hypothetical protein